MELIGKAPINPILFYSGKISGYITWIILFLLLFGFEIFDNPVKNNITYISFLFIIVGSIFILSSLISLGHSIRLGIPIEDTVLKIKEMYKISRNPMYVGFNSLTISSMLFTQNILIAVLGIYSIYIYHLIIIAEEQFLEKRFGNEYDNYKRSTRRYL